MLTTRPIIWGKEQQHLFVNVVVQPGGFVQVAVLIKLTNSSSSRSSSSPAGDFTVVHGLEWENSTVGNLAPNTCVDPSASPFDSTRTRVSWAGNQSLRSVAGKVAKLQFRLSGASLYSFWFSRSERCGESGGFLGAGGPGSVKGVDVHGSCAPAGANLTSITATALKTSDSAALAVPSSAGLTVELGVAKLF